MENLKREISKNTRAVLFINYFGFPQPNAAEIKSIAGDKIVIEDLVQSFLTQTDGKPLGFIGDATISSYRKWLPIPDGSLLGINNTKIKLPLSTLRPSNSLYVETRLKALKQKGLYLSQTVSKRSFRKLLTCAEALLDSTPSFMSDYSRTLIDKFDFKKIVDTRRINYKFLLDELSDLDNVEPLHPTLPLNVCPLGFPITTKRRSQLKKLLIINKIYCPIHWPLTKEIDRNQFSASWFLSKHILTIPIDQRYNLDNMQYVVSVLKKFERES